MTIYQNGSGLVTERYRFEHPAGTMTLRLLQAPAALEPRSLQAVFDHDDIHLREPGTVDVGDVAGSQIRPFGLKALSPNPYRGPVTLELSLEEAGLADLAIYDVQGRLVRHLVNGRQEAGVHRVAWDGRDQFGRNLGSGVYVARLANGKSASSVKLVRTR